MKMIFCDEELEVEKCHVEVKKSYGKLCYAIMVGCKTKHFGVYDWYMVDCISDPEEALMIESKINESIFLEESQSTLKDLSFNNLLDEIDQEVDNEE